MQSIPPGILPSMRHCGDCLFGYAGRFADDHSVRLLELGNLVFDGPASGTPDEGPSGFSGRHAGYVLVEAFQNIIRHRAVEARGAAMARSLFAFRKDARGLGLYTRNAVAPVKAKGLGEALTFLSAKDAAELKALFLRGIQQPGVEGRRGAGLGLIEMVRRTGARPQWSFSACGPGQQQFTLVLEQGDRLPGEGLEALMESRIWPWMLAGKVQLFYAGTWSGRVEKVWIDLVRGEEGPQSRPHAGGEAWERTLSTYMPALAIGGPVLIALHEGGTITAAGTMQQDAVAAFRSSAVGTLEVQDGPLDAASGRMQVLASIAR